MDTRFSEYRIMWVLVLIQVDQPVQQLELF